MAYNSLYFFVSLVPFPPSIVLFVPVPTTFFSGPLCPQSPSQHSRLSQSSPCSSLRSSIYVCSSHLHFSNFTAFFITRLLRSSSSYVPVCFFRLLSATSTLLFTALTPCSSTQCLSHTTLARLSTSILPGYAVSRP